MLHRQPKLTYTLILGTPSPFRIFGKQLRVNLFGDCGRRRTTLISLRVRPWQVSLDFDVIVESSIHMSLVGACTAVRPKLKSLRPTPGAGMHGRVLSGTSWGPEATPLPPQRSAGCACAMLLPGALRLGPPPEAAQCCAPALQAAAGRAPGGHRAGETGTWHPSPVFAHGLHGIHDLREPAHDWHRVCRWSGCHAGMAPDGHCVTRAGAWSPSGVPPPSF